MRRDNVVTPMLLVPTRARCEDEMAQTFATVVPVPGLSLNVAAQLSVACGFHEVSMTLNPIDAARQLRPYVAPMFPNVWLPDVLTNEATKAEYKIFGHLATTIGPLATLTAVTSSFSCWGCPPLFTAPYRTSSDFVRGTSTGADSVALGLSRCGP